MIPIGGVGDQQIRTANKIGQPFHVREVVTRVGLQVKLVIRDVTDFPAITSEFVAEAVAGMLQQHRFDSHRAEFERFLAQIAEQQPRAEFSNGHGKINALHLCRDGALDSQVALIGPEQFDLVAAHIQGPEKGDGVDMIPVRVRNENPCREALHFCRIDAIRKLLDTGATIEDEQRLAADLDRDARSIAAVAQRARATYRQCAVHPPVRYRNALRQYFIDLLHQRLGLDRLDDIAVSPEFLGTAAVEIVSLRCAHDDLDVGEVRPFAHFAAKLEAVHLRHDYVGDHAVGPLDGNFA